MRDVARTPAPPAERRHRPSPQRALTSIERLQRSAGNRAVAGLIRGAPGVVQRATEITAPPDRQGFTEAEDLWIDDVWHNPGMELMFQAYGEIPAPVLARVGQILDDGSPSETTEGAATNEPAPGEPDIEIGDAVYVEKKVVEPSGEMPREATEEEEFKSTLIHELFHYVENNTKDIDPEAFVTPETLKAILAAPTLASLPQFTFGYFIRGGGVGYLPEATVTMMSSHGAWTWVEPGSPEAEAKKEKRYEPSPDPRGLEEDLATTIGYFLAGPDMRQTLRANYPKRFNLMNGYFKQLEALMAAGGAGG
jgi:hypothetical protein